MKIAIRIAGILLLIGLICGAVTPCVPEATPLWEGLISVGFFAFLLGGIAAFACAIARAWRAPGAPRKLFWLGTALLILLLAFYGAMRVLEPMLILQSRMPPHLL